MLMLLVASTNGWIAQNQLVSAVDHVAGVQHPCLVGARRSASTINIIVTGAVEARVAAMHCGRNPVRCQLVVQRGRKYAVDFLPVGPDADRAHLEQVTDAVAQVVDGVTRLRTAVNL